MGFFTACSFKHMGGFQLWISRGGRGQNLSLHSLCFFPILNCRSTIQSVITTWNTWEICWLVVSSCSMIYIWIWQVVASTSWTLFLSSTGIIMIYCPENMKLMNRKQKVLFDGKQVQDNTWKGKLCCTVLNSNELELLFAWLKIVSRVFLEG